MRPPITNGVYSLGNPTWAENTINFNNAPPISGTPIELHGPDARTPTSRSACRRASSPGQPVTFALKGTGTNSLIVNSREAASNPPQLVIDSGGGGGAADSGRAPSAAAPSSGTAPLTVTFTDQSTSNPTAWSWNFGDPGSGAQNTSTVQNPTHTFASPATTP